MTPKEWNFFIYVEAEREANGDPFIRELTQEILTVTSTRFIDGLVQFMIESLPFVQLTFTIGLIPL